MENKKSIWGKIIHIIITVLTAIATTFGVTSCMGVLKKGGCACLEHTPVPCQNGHLHQPKALEEKGIGISGFRTIRQPSSCFGSDSPRRFFIAARDPVPSSGNGVKSA